MRKTRLLNPGTIYESQTRLICANWYTGCLQNSVLQLNSNKLPIFYSDWLIRKQEQYE